MPFIVKAENGTRTHDPFITSEVLYRLSYFSTGITTFVIINASGKKCKKKICKPELFESGFLFVTMFHKLNEQI